MERHPASTGSRQELGRLLEAVLSNRGQANAVFDILAVLQVSGAGDRGGPGAAIGVTTEPSVTLSGSPSQSEDPEEIKEGVRTCSRLFGTLLEREELFVGSLPCEDMALAGE